MKMDSDLINLIEAQWGEDKFLIFYLPTPLYAERRGVA